MLAFARLTRLHADGIRDQITVLDVTIFFLNMAACIITTKNIMQYRDIVWSPYRPSFLSTWGQKPSARL